MSTLSVRLRELRGDSSQAEMANSIGIPQQAWARYEKGIVSPNASTIESICRAHACSADWLLGLKDSAALSVRAGNGAAVAIGANARASSTALSSTSAQCAKCPYKKWGEKLRKQGLIIPGVE